MVLSYEWPHIETFREKDYGVQGSGLQGKMYQMSHVQVLHKAQQSVVHWWVVWSERHVGTCGGQGQGAGATGATGATGGQITRGVKG